MRKIIIPFTIFLLITVAFAAYQDYTTFTEVDPGADITVTSSKITLTNFETRDLDSYVYKEISTAGDFAYDWTVYSAGVDADDYVVLLCISQRPNDIAAIQALPEEFFNVRIWADTLKLVEFTSTGTAYTTKYNADMSDAFTLYLTIQRKGSDVGNGTLYLGIFSDASRTTGLDTLSIALHEDNDFSHLMQCVSTNNSVAGKLWTGYMENLDLSSTVDLSIPASSIGVKNVIVMTQ